MKIGVFATFMSPNATPAMIRDFGRIEVAQGLRIVQQHVAAQRQPRMAGRLQPQRLPLLRQRQGFLQQGQLAVVVVFGLVQRGGHQAQRNLEIAVVPHSHLARALGRQRQRAIDVVVRSGKVATQPCQP